MKRTLHYVIISLLVAVGVAVLVVGILFFHALVTVPSAEPVFENEVFGADEVGIIDVDISVGYVNVYKTSGTDIEVEFVGHRKGLYSASLSGGTLTVSELETSWTDRLFRSYSKRFGIDIGIPDGTELTLNISSSNSDIETQGVVLSGDSSFSTEDGKVSLNGVTSDGAISISVSSGDVSLNAVSCTSLTVGVTEGSIVLDGADAEDAVSLSVEKGSITGSLARPRGDYTVDASVVTGICDVKNGGTGKTTLTAKVKEGTIALSFGE